MTASSIDGLTSTQPPILTLETSQAESITYHFLANPSKS